MATYVHGLGMWLALAACGGAKPQTLSNRSDAPAGRHADTDADGDGIDSFDGCDLAPEDFDGFADSDGCPDPDNDQDLVLDGNDSCPNDPEDMDQDADQDGCPE
jgi:hypothetical protein